MTEAPRPGCACGARKQAFQSFKYIDGKPTRVLLDEPCRCQPPWLDARYTRPRASVRAVAGTVWWATYRAVIAAGRWATRQREAMRGEP